MNGPDLHQRMALAVGSRSFRAIADLTGAHAETVRRYMHGQPPSVEFLGALCVALDISAQWMLTGEGPMLRAEARAHALREADPADLLTALAASIAGLATRVARIEQLVLPLDSAIPPPTPPAPDAKVPDPTPEADTRERARRIADGVAKRSRPDAG